jgi:crotonobetainyl-CoA hydratase
MERSRALAVTIAEGAPLALQALLEVVPVLDRMGEREAFARLKPGRSGLETYERMLASEDFKEGPRAFFEKRKPLWRGH